jgi:anti-anti-sigma factor
MEMRVVVFSGEYDIACIEQLREELGRLVAMERVILDFTDVTYIDSTTVGELVRLHKRRAENLFERETIVVRNRGVQKIFDLLELRKVFRLVATLEEAVDPGVQTTVRRAFCGGPSPDAAPDVTDSETSRSPS